MWNTKQQQQLDAHKRGPRVTIIDTADALRVWWLKTIAETIIMQELWSEYTHASPSLTAYTNANTKSCSSTPTPCKVESAACLRQTHRWADWNGRGFWGEGPPPCSSAWHMWFCAWSCASNIASFFILQSITDHYRLIGFNNWRFNKVFLLANSWWRLKNL